MKSASTLLLVTLFSFASHSSSFAQATKPDDADKADSVHEVRGDIRSVTVFREQAMVSRQIAFPAGEGMRTIKVTGLPDALIPDSLFAEGDDGTTVRAVRVVPRVVSQSNREEVRNLEEENATIERELLAKNQQIEVLHQQKLSLDRLFDFSAAKTSDDLNRATLDVDSLIKISEYCDRQREKIANERLAKSDEVEKLQQSLAVNRKKLDHLAAGGSRTVFEAVVFVETDAGADGAVTLRYRVGNCGWTPQYTIAGQRKSDAFQLRYGALVTQTSGEDWSGVELVLSTASASVHAAGPILTPLRVTTSDKANSGNIGSGDYRSQLQTLREQQRSAESWGSISGMGGMGGGMGGGGNGGGDRDIALNSFAAQMQRLEWLAQSDSTRGLAPDASEEVSTQTYRIEQPVSLASRREQQLVQILNAELSGEMVHVATPLLSSYAYRQAILENSTKIGLMSGPAMVYLDSRFVGRTDVPPTASGQRLVVGFGADQQIRTRRELISKRDDIQGGNRRLQFDYRVVVSNFKDEPVKMRVLDRLPNAKQSQSISLELQPTKLPISDDALYVRMRRPQGILRWDVDVPAGRHGSDAFDIEYSFTAAFDRNQFLTTESVATVRADYQMEQFGGMGGGMGGFGGN